MNPIDCAWAAGLFEGEGCITYKTRYGRPYVYLELRMTDRDVVERFQKIVGYGNVRLSPKREAHWKDQWDWTIARRTEVVRILEAFLPFFGSRRAAKARDVLERYS